MPSYRGVDKADIKESIKRAVARLREWDLGDATKDMLDVWKSGSPYTTLDIAANDREMAVMMNISGTKNLFPRLTNVFRYHAALGAKGEGPKGDQKLFKDLVAWGAFVPPDEPDESWMAVQDEVNQYMLKRCLDRLTLEDCQPGGAGYETFQKALASVKNEDPETKKWIIDTEKWFRESVPQYIFLHSIDEDDRIVDLLDHMPKINNFMIRTLYKMTGLPAEEKKIDLKHPLGYYHAVVPYPGEEPGETVRGTFNEQARARIHEIFMRGVRKEVLSALEPFIQTDNASTKLAAEEIAEAGACSLTFLSSREAAQAAADTLPYEIFDEYDKQIVPSTRQALPPPSLQQ